MNLDAKKRRSEELSRLYREAQDEDYAQTQADFKELLKLPAFRRVLIGILKKARVFGSIAMDVTPTNEVMKLVGWRELGVEIYCTANMADGSMVVQAMDERARVERERKARFEAIIKNSETKGKNQP